MIDEWKETAVLVDVVAFHFAMPTRQGFAMCRVDKDNNKLIKGEIEWFTEKNKLEGGLFRPQSEMPTLS